ncbi:MAG: Glu/Leu/Phe/Val dehydrogenase dimerization domain-containing protein [Candidatus Paceibacterota bacterium]|jgi:glutamate dehydrogenase/leucine dehydrogenase
MNQIENKLLEKFTEFDNHQSVFRLDDEATGLKGFIAFHKNQKRVPSFGATRFLEYKTEDDALRDALRLSRLMSYKSAMAGFKYGGAKAVIIRNDEFPKDKILKAYAQKLNELSGKFITGTDVGLDLTDLKKMKRESEYFVGLKSNPEKYTAVGLFFSIEVACKKIFGNESFKDRTFAIQGVGKVGHEFLKIVYKNAGKIYISDTNIDRLKFIQKLFPKVKIVAPDKIQKQKVDVYMPCALSYALNKKTIGELNCKIITGSANNQLESKDIADKIYEKGIFYGPDYVVNAGGLISVVDEYENKNFDADRIEGKVKKIKKTLEKIMEGSDKEKISPARVADRMAEKIINKLKN